MSRAPFLPEDQPRWNGSGLQRRSLTTMPCRVYGSFQRGNELREIAVSAHSSDASRRADRLLKAKTRRDAPLLTFRALLFPGS